MLITYGGIAPRVDPSAYIQSSARVIGDVHIGAESSVWFNAVVRGDVHPIRIGARTNVQDNATLHVTGGRWATHVGDGVTIAHAVVLHGCRVGNHCLIGIGAIVMDGCEIGDECLVAAGALVTPNKRVPAGELWAGSPARKLRDLSPDERATLTFTAKAYAAFAQEHRAACAAARADA